MTLVSFGLLEGRLPPTIIDALWRGSFSVSRKPFVMCYNVHHPSLRISEEERKKTCEYLQRFGRTREEQVRTYYLWAQTLQVCRMISRDVGVDVETVKRDLNMPYVSHGRVDVVVGSPPCHEFSVATVSRAKRIDVGLQLVHSYLRSVELINPALAVMEEATTTGESQKLVTSLVGQYGFSYSYYDLRDFGAIQYKRRRLIAWKISK
jgi:site-specific DNA-cytosine methylase